MWWVYLVVAACIVIAFVFGRMYESFKMHDLRIGTLYVNPDNKEVYSVFDVEPQNLQDGMNIMMDVKKTIDISSST